METDREWRYENSFEVTRRDRLEAWNDFKEIVSLLKDSIRHIGLRACPGSDVALQGYVQPIYTITVTKDAFDAFFNSPSGYRASYLRDPNLGLLANLQLLESLLERLLDVAQHECISELAAIDLRKSLLAASSKVWICEEDFPFQSPTRDLAVRAWIDAAAKGEKKANWGLCAPLGARIEVKGALLDPSGNEIVPWKKVLRRYEIHRLGFS